MSWRQVLYIPIAGDPVAKGRPRVSTFGGRARMYTPKKTAAYEEWVSACAENAIVQSTDEFPLSGSLRVDITAVFKRPARLFRKKDSAARMAKPTKPDLDNVIKGILDGLNHSGLWGDDAQVVEIHASKMWGSVIDRKEKADEPAYVSVTISAEAE